MKYINKKMNIWKENGIIMVKYNIEMYKIILKL